MYVDLWQLRRREVENAASCKLLALVLDLGADICKHFKRSKQLVLAWRFFTGRECGKYRSHIL